MAGSGAGQTGVLLLQTDTCTGDFQRIDSALVVSELVQSRAGLVGAVKAVLVFDAANSS